MFTNQTPLKVIFDPFDDVRGFPGETLELHAIISNQGDRGAEINVFLDRVSQTLNDWCANTQTQLALDPQQNGKVTFQFQIPLEALPGTYNYTLVVDSLEYYPEDTPIQYPRQLKVLHEERAIVRSQDPSFTITPASNPDSPLPLEPEELLQLLVIVTNRSNRVDRFYLRCSDIDENWFGVKYAPNQLQGSGIVLATDGLELNPQQQGEIALELRLPAHTPAGHYSPTVQLRSANAPDLVLLDLIYFKVPPVYSFDVELKTILGKVSHQSGQYQLQLTNKGNQLRKLKISVKSQDGDGLCDYIYERSPVQLAIGLQTNVDLNVKPIRRWWRRPLFGSGLQLPFKIELQDLQGLPVPERLPKGMLLWKTRPWWQLLLIFLGGSSLIFGLGFVIWLIFFRAVPLPELVEFQPDSPTYTEGGRVRLDWKIRNAHRLKKITLVTTAKDTASGKPEHFDIDEGMPQGSLEKFCTTQDRILNCHKVYTEATVPGKYQFTLKLEVLHSDKIVEKIEDAEIKPKPAPEIVDFSASKAQYQQNERLLLSWKIKNFNQMTQLQAVSKTDHGIAKTPTIFNFNGEITQNLRQYCSQPVNNELSCNNVPVRLPTTSGSYKLQLQPKSDNYQQPQPSESITVQVLATPPEIVAFTLNGKTPQQSPTVFLQEGDNITLGWRTKGDDVNAILDPFGNVATIGSRNLKATTKLSQIVLTVTNNQGQSVKQSFLLEVQPPSPPPTQDPLPDSTPSPSL